MRRKRESDNAHPTLKRSEKIYIAGHAGLAGGAITRLLRARGFSHLVTRSRAEVDLRSYHAVHGFFEAEKPEVVVLAAARVGGIRANSEEPVEFLLENLQIQNAVLSAAHRFGVRKLVFLGSSCIYPKFAPQPIPENALLTGSLEPTNASYAIAKIAGITLCQAMAQQYGANFISAMPTNLYGPNDNFDLETSHVLAALLHKAHHARVKKSRTLIVWGTGRPRREFLHADDLASAILFLLENYDSPEIINVGCGEDISIRELAELICDIVGFEGDLVWDESKPDGTPRKLLDISKILQLGWKPCMSLREGITRTYEWFLNHDAGEFES